MENTVKFESNSLFKKIKSMLTVDLIRMLKSRLFYIMLGIALVTPILIIVMTSMMEGTVQTDQYGNPILDEFGNPVLMEGFKTAWQSIGGLSTAPMSMDLTAMCNINLIFFGISVFVCLFISDDFRSGYSKNLFTVRSKKIDYVISKTMVSYITGVLMLLCYFIGSMLGSAISSLSFEMDGFNISNVLMCMLSKVFLMGVFVSIFTLISVCTKSKAWLSILISIGGGMLLFMMIPSLTPIDSTIMNVILCFAGGLLFAIGLGAISNIILKKTSLI